MGDTGYTSATYGYDAMNRLVATRRDGGFVETRGKDANGRLLARWYVKPGGSVDTQID